MSELVNLHTIGNAILVWLMIGAVLWMVLDGIGTVKASHTRRLALGGARIDTVIATLIAIAAWPFVAREILRHPKITAAKLYWNLWGARRGRGWR